MKLLYRHLAPLFFASFSLAAQAEGGSAQPKVKLTTNHGDIVIALNAEKAPETVKNFIQYVESGFYDGTIFHRVIENFMIQGGGFDESFKQKTTEAPIQNEADNGLSNTKGTVAMARTGDPHSATAQFFINTKDNDFLNYRGKTMQDWGYAVFGEVIEGMDVVDAIRKVKTTMRGGHQDVPADAVVIEKAIMVD
ncbi:MULTISPECIES: peptidylprolyl isomerase [unclassified Methylophaga]|jgi:peptidyl-prolyl cis-trans isomerase B (cyclophilin B)|uniref:peptidylprolyl isomerase n=1 Tax=unclassified Methylophaga TaxID=2629249 RepID=UPI000C90DCC8|nr:MULTISPECIES: peptidylprolyl isomerase [unclassified Methylophaga]MAK66994.1 peptidylprolyl isomerase [Methylophaga sp.]MAY18031.1 peptidylprolyl isomerase [Methylophaga sp.]MBN45460.1 peptidylprolyl isomerase [Methylophaga sp.]HCD06447.1 peptidylprolyl isomerase [Methylophaga sp.]|tara:strand:- start:3259 stop:3840 length:582 start_codon:yes stop_codon:yes gene_type:complete